MKQRVLNLDQFIAEDSRIDRELNSLVEIAVNEQETTEQYRETCKSILKENFGVTSIEVLTFDQKSKYVDILKSTDMIKESIERAEQLDESLKEEYQTYFRECLKGFGIKNLSELTKETKPKFWKTVKEGWEKGKGRKESGEKKIEEAEINEAEIKSEEEFRKYAEARLKKMHKDDFDETKAKETIDGLLKKKKEDNLEFGALVGMLG